MGSRALVQDEFYGALVEQFGAGWFVAYEIDSPKPHQSDRLAVLCARGLLVRRAVTLHDPRRLRVQANAQFEYRVVES